jgi:hypothetical protein
VQLPSPFGVCLEELAAMSRRAESLPPQPPESRWALADGALLVVLAKQSDRMRFAFGGAMVLGGGTFWRELKRSSEISAEAASRAAAEEADAARRQALRVAALARSEESTAAEGEGEAKPAAEEPDPAAAAEAATAEKYAPETGWVPVSNAAWAAAATAMVLP